LSKDPIKEYLKDPDKRAKLFLLITGGMILSTVLIVIGTLIFILMLLGII
jgi:prolipoprotein diacylglyceryltransferase